MWVFWSVFLPISLGIWFGYLAPHLCSLLSDAWFVLFFSRHCFFFIPRNNYCFSSKSILNNEWRIILLPLFFKKAFDMLTSLKRQMWLIWNNLMPFVSSFLVSLTFKALRALIRDSSFRWQKTWSQFSDLETENRI